MCSSAPFVSTRTLPDLLLQIPDIPGTLNLSSRTRLATSGRSSHGPSLPVVSGTPWGRPDGRSRRRVKNTSEHTAEKGLSCRST